MDKDVENKEDFKEFFRGAYNVYMRRFYRCWKQGKTWSDLKAEYEKQVEDAMASKLQLVKDDKVKAMLDAQQARF